jgi:hypothetical protein
LFDNQIGVFFITVRLTGIHFHTGFSVTRGDISHSLYQSAGLLILAGLVDSQTGKPVDDTAALLGALASLNDLSRDNPKWSDWKIRGQELLNSKKSDSSA